MKRCENEHLTRKNGQKRRKSDASYNPSDETLDLGFYNTYRKMKNVIKRIFPLLEMPPNFIRFRQNVGFQSPFGNFISLSGHLRTALTKNQL